MNMDIRIRTMSKKNITVLVITFLLALVFWGNGFWALGQPEWSGGADRLTYIKAARNFFDQKKLYLDIHQPLPEDLNFYNYSPLSVFTIGVLSLLPPTLLYGLHLIAVIGLFLLWKRILQGINIEIPFWILPFWFVFSPFVFDAVTLNVNVFMALLASLYLWFLLKDHRSARLGAIVMLFLMMTIKPQWGFFAFLPLIQRRWKDFGQMILGFAILFLALFGIGSLLTNFGYVLNQHILYVQHLGTFAQRFTYWNLPPGPYEYNNSIDQVFIYLLGNIQAGITTAKLVQLGFFIILATVFAMTVFTKGTEENGEQQDRNTIRWFFIFYCATLLYPPLNFDFSLGIPMFLFLAAQGRLQRILVGIPLLIVAFQDIIRIVIGLLGADGWFPFIFADAVVALIFLLSMRPGLIHNERKVFLAADQH
jgi:hypothetical protein